MVDSAALAVLWALGAGPSPLSSLVLCTPCCVPTCGFWDSTRLPPEAAKHPHPSPELGHRFREAWWVPYLALDGMVTPNRRQPADAARPRPERRLWASRSPTAALARSRKRQTGRGPRCRRHDTTQLTLPACGAASA